jgi:hypothetical protein
MSEAAEITLARALKVKNRLAGLISKLNQDIAAYNSVQEGTEQPDVRAFYEGRKALARHLVALKSAITLANAPVQAVIYELAELKALVALVNGLNTKHGKFVEGYSTTGISYVAQMRRADIDNEVRRLQSDIDRLQDQLDTFNHTTRVRVDTEALAIADGKKPAAAVKPSGTA